MKVWLPAIRAGSGADVFTERLAAGLARAGCEPIVTWIPHRYELWPELFRSPPPAGTQLIHANSWSAFAFVRHGLPTVATEHGFVGDPNFVKSKTLKQRIYHDLLIGRHVHRSYRECAVVTAVSNYLADAIRPRCRDAVVIPNWVDTDLFQPVRLQRQGRPFRVLYAGTRAFHKGFDVVRGLARSSNPGIELLCQKSLQPYLGNCRSDVHFFDKIPPSSMPELYARCDAVLVPSRYEGFGYVALEAMACARPVIGFDGGALHEVCGDGEAAVLVPMGDETAIRQAILALANDEALASRMGEAGRQRALEHFGEAKAIGAYMSVYQRLIG